MRKTLIIAAALSVAAAGQAAAHARLLKSNPAKGATVAAPKALTLTYSEEIVPEKSTVAVTTAGKAAPTGPLSFDKTKKVVTVPVTGALAPGAYKVDWKMTTEDTHVMSGTFGFKVK